MTIAVGDLGVANTTSMAVAGLGTRLDVVRPYPRRGNPDDDAAEDGRHQRVGLALGCCTATRSATATCAAEITVDGGKTLFGGFGNLNTARVGRTAANPTSPNC